MFGVIIVTFFLASLMLGRVQQKDDIYNSPIFGSYVFNLFIGFMAVMFTQHREDGIFNGCVYIIGCIINIMLTHKELKAVEGINVILIGLTLFVMILF